MIWVALFFRIRKICNLQDLLKLDVLDLHGNKVFTIRHSRMFNV